MTEKDQRKMILRNYKFCVLKDMIVFYFKSRKAMKKKDRVDFEDILNEYCAYIDNDKEGNLLFLDLYEVYSKMVAKYDDETSTGD